MNTILSYLAAIAAEFASTRLIFTEGWQGGYMEEDVSYTEIRTVESFWNPGFSALAAEEQPTSIAYGQQLNPNVQARTYDPFISLWHNDASGLPAADSQEALNLLISWMQESLDNEISNGGCSLETEEAYEKREAEKRFKELEGVARQLLKDNPNDNLFDVLTGMRAAAEDRIYGLQEDGLCATGGFGQAALNDWYDLRNHYCGQAQEAMELFDFCTCHYPLTYLAWQEAKAENVNA